jgi:hypothetical protein
MAADNGLFSTATVLRYPYSRRRAVVGGRSLAAGDNVMRGVLLGTRFYASEEADGHAEAKRRVVVAEGGSAPCCLARLAQGVADANLLGVAVSSASRKQAWQFVNAITEIHMVEAPEDRGGVGCLRDHPERFC